MVSNAAATQRQQRQHIPNWGLTTNFQSSFSPNGREVWVGITVPHTDEGITMLETTVRSYCEGLREGLGRQPAGSSNSSEPRNTAEMGTEQRQGQAQTQKKHNISPSGIERIRKATKKRWRLAQAQKKRAQKTQTAGGATA